MVRVPFFGHKTQGLHCCYLPNYTWNQFKCESFDNSYGGGDFSHAYVIMHQYFGKKPKMKKKKKNSKQVDKFLSLAGTKNQLDGKINNFFPCSPFEMNYLTFKILVPCMI
jgi:hypothetical protein